MVYEKTTISELNSCDSDHANQQVELDGIVRGLLTRHSWFTNRTTFEGWLSDGTRLLRFNGRDYRSTLYVSSLLKASSEENKPIRVHGRFVQENCLAPLIFLHGVSYAGKSYRML